MLLKGGFNHIFGKQVSSIAFCLNPLNNQLAFFFQVPEQPISNIHMLSITTDGAMTVHIQLHGGLHFQA